MNLLRQALWSDLNTARTVYGSLPTPRTGTPNRPHYDVAVIGAGLAGLNTALELRQLGQSVIIFEAAQVGAAASGRNGGQLWPGSCLSIGEMSDKFGPPKAVEFWQMAHAVLPDIHRHLDRHPNKCGFAAGTLKLATTPKQAEQCNLEAEQLQAAGLDYATYISAEKLKSSYVAANGFYGGILYAAPYGHFNPLQYIQLLTQIFLESGGELIEHSPIRAISARPDGYELTLAQQVRIKAKTVVLACGTRKDLLPKGIPVESVKSVAIPAQSVILATEPFSAELGRRLFPNNVCYADANLVCDYARLAACEDGTDRVRLLYGGADAFLQFRLSAALDVLRLKRSLYRTFPLLKEHGIRVERLWGGHECLSLLHVPALQVLAPNLYSLSSFGGQGNVLSSVCASALARHIGHGADTVFDLLTEFSCAIPALPHMKLLAQLKLARALY